MDVQHVLQADLYVCDPSKKKGLLLRDWSKWCKLLALKKTHLHISSSLCLCDLCTQPISQKHGHSLHWILEYITALNTILCTKYKAWGLPDWHNLQQTRKRSLPCIKLYWWRIEAFELHHKKPVSIWTKKSRLVYKHPLLNYTVRLFLYFYTLLTIVSVLYCSLSFLTCASNCKSAAWTFTKR